MNLFVICSENHKANTHTPLAFLFPKCMKAGQNSQGGGKNQQNSSLLIFCLKKICPELSHSQAAEKIFISYSVFETGKQI